MKFVILPLWLFALLTAGCTASPDAGKEITPTPTIVTATPLPRPETPTPEPEPEPFPTTARLSPSQSEPMLEILESSFPEITRERLVLFVVSIEDNQGEVTEYGWVRSYQMQEGKLVESGYWVDLVSGKVVKLSFAESGDERIILGLEEMVEGEKVIREVFLSFNKIEGYPEFVELSNTEIRERMAAMSQEEKQALAEYINFNLFPQVIEKIMNGQEDEIESQPLGVGVSAALVPERRAVYLEDGQGGDWEFLPTPPAADRVVWQYWKNEEGRTVMGRETGKAQYSYNEIEGKWEIILPFEVNLEKGEYRSMTDEEVEIIRQGLQNDERKEELKGGNGFVFRLPQTGQRIAVVVPHNVEIGDLEDPDLNRYPIYRDLTSSGVEELLMQMRLDVEGENWDDMVEDGRTAGLIVVQMSFIKGGEWRVGGMLGYIIDTNVDEKFLPNTMLHVLTCDFYEAKNRGSWWTQERFEEYRDDFPNIYYSHSLTGTVVKGIVMAIHGGLYRVQDRITMLKEFGSKVNMDELLMKMGYPFYIHVD